MQMSALSLFLCTADIQCQKKLEPNRLPLVFNDTEYSDFDFVGYYLLLPTHIYSCFLLYQQPTYTYDIAQIACYRMDEQTGI